ncbi:hypothetical protein KR767_10070 [Luteibacter anthropi]|uniref:Secreted protein n=1 Tax=Luteibacter anthropi TaxID=564369 RepID=A0A7X5ZJX5_9GAMM|nr:hypothetical protein [Luteibacter anthropi]NII08284.1 hypothetical protein [Luteibacter anthropi]URX64360.1 hypothetical protein KR767_10070 [Luteibacter anthropi]
MTKHVIRAFVVGLLASGFSFATLAGTADTRGASAVADAWIGHEAADLLMQWPVDRGFQQTEMENGATAYEYHFGTEAYHAKGSTSTLGAGPTPGGVMQTISYYDYWVPAQTHCVVVFFANRDGIIDDYKFNGERCKPYMSSWGKPKKS